MTRSAHYPFEVIETPPTPIEVIHGFIKRCDRIMSERGFKLNNRYRNKYGDVTQVSYFHEGDRVFVFVKPPYVHSTRIARCS